MMVESDNRERIDELDEEGGGDDDSPSEAGVYRDSVASAPDFAELPRKEQREGPSRPLSRLAALWSCGQSIVIATVVMGALVAACYVTAHLLYVSVPEAREASANISSHLDLGHIQRGLSAMHTYVEKAHNLSVLLFGLIFTIKTTFSIPGATPLCVIAGALFPWWEAVLLCTFLVIVGSFFSYGISKYLLTTEVLNYLASEERVEKFRAQVDQARAENRLFWALLALRLFPLTPGSVINTVSPHVNVPVGVFTLSIIGGNLPYILITTAAGETLSSIKSMGDILSFRMSVEFTLLAIISLVPVVLKRRMQQADAAAPVAYNALNQSEAAALAPAAAVVVEMPTMGASCALPEDSNDEIDEIFSDSDAGDVLPPSGDLR